VPGNVEKWALVKDISFSHVLLDNVQSFVMGTNIPPVRPLDGLTLTDITGKCSRGIILTNVINAKFENIKVTGFKGPLFVTNSVQMAP
jgi:hypothetical protein